MISTPTPVETRSHSFFPVEDRLRTRINGAAGRRLTRQFRETESPYKGRRSFGGSSKFSPGWSEVAGGRPKEGKARIIPLEEVVAGSNNRHHGFWRLVPAGTVEFAKGLGRKRTRTMVQRLGPRENLSLSRPSSLTSVPFPANFPREVHRRVGD